MRFSIDEIPGSSIPATADGLLARLERIPTSMWHVRTRMIVGVATFFDAFDILALAFVLPALMRDWHLTTAQAGLLISAGFAGQFVGAFVFGALAERIGRIPTITISVALFSIASVLCAFTNSAAVLMMLRAVQGIGLGGEVPVAATYVNELTKSHKRGRFILLYEIIFPVGIVFAGLLGTWLVPTYGWRYMFLVGGLPAILTLFMTRLLPESPRWMINKGKLAEAEAVIVTIEAASLSSSADVVSVAGTSPTSRPSTPSAGNAPAGAPKPVKLEILSRFYRRRTLVIWSLWFSSAFVVYGLVSWLPTIYTTVYSVPVNEALLFGLVTNVAGLLGTVCCALLIDWSGRRMWFKGAFAFGALTLLLTAKATSLWLVVILASASYFFINTTALALYVYTPECYPTRFRAFGTSVATAWQRVAAVIGPLFVGKLMGGQQVTHVFGLYCFISLLGLAASFAITETANRSLEELSP
ncbi:MFS transporter (plasmid) [Burkholderia sp. M6-3]